MTAPERMWSPKFAAFSMTATTMSTPSVSSLMGLPSFSPLATEALCWAMSFVSCKVADRPAADKHDARFHGVSLDHDRYLSFFKDVRTLKERRISPRGKSAHWLTTVANIAFPSRDGEAGLSPAEPEGGKVWKPSQGFHIREESAVTYLPASKRYDQMLYRRCGRSGLDLPAISLGLWHNFGGVDVFENARAMARRAFDLGITHFDLANNYGPPPGSAESAFGEILRLDLKPYRDELIISSKAGYDMWPGPYGNWGSRKYLLSSLYQS